MESSVFLVSFLATSPVTLAAPAASVDLAKLPSDTSIEIWSLNRVDAPLAILEQREYRVCEIVDRTIRTIGTSKFTSPTKRHVDVPQDYIRLWETMLSSSNDISYDRLATLAFQSDNATLTRRQGEPALVHHLQVTGFTLGNSPRHDIIVNHYDNGDTVLQVHLPGGNSVANGTVGSSSNFHKRFDKAVFKIAFTTRDRSRLTQAHQKSMALAGAAASAVYADNASYKMNEFIGFAETEHAADFYYRIIPEIRGFGTNYETVDACDGMASYL